MALKSHFKVPIKCPGCGHTTPKIPQGSRKGSDCRVHLRCQDRGWWRPQEDQSSRPRSTGSFVVEVTALAFELPAFFEKSELIIQKKDGKISQKDSHGNDPRNVRGLTSYRMHPHG